MSTSPRDHPSPSRAPRPTCPSYINNAAAATTNDDYCTKLAQKHKHKHTKYDKLASKLDCRVVAATFTTYGLRPTEAGTCAGFTISRSPSFVDPPYYSYKKELKEGRSQEWRIRLGRSKGMSVEAVQLRYERHVAAVMGECSHGRLDARRLQPCQGNPPLCTAAVSSSG